MKNETINKYWPNAGLGAKRGKGCVWGAGGGGVTNTYKLKAYTNETQKKKPHKKQNKKGKGAPDLRNITMTNNNSNFKFEGRIKFF